MKTENCFLMEYPSPVGLLTLAADDTAVVGLWMAGQKYFAKTLPREPQWKAAPALAKASAWLDSYFAGERPEVMPPLAPKGTPFQQAVWKELLAIPYGELATYGAIAARLNSSARAVGSAVGHNPVSILIPCHRVVGGDGSLTGYAGGLERKIQLLNLEGVDTGGLRIPRRGTAL
ncbi:MAG TPA: methylated-DNA--[protein]-cysteine S-methyltransferase [Terriglobales bacterium]|nr:methylated-DNA--[protein]-cysteine S-methyltransferase [Terriglobales bacterium]